VGSRGEREPEPLKEGYIMGDARRLVGETQEELKAIEERIRRHPYLDLLEAGRIPENQFQLFAGQQYHIISSDLRAMALLIAKAESLETREFFWGGLQGERAALEALRTFATAIGMGAEDLTAVDPIPGAFAYSAFVAWLALFGSTAEFAAAFLVNLEAWGGNCARMSRDLKARYGLQEADVTFFDLFASPPPGFQERALRVIQEGLDRGVAPRAVERAARLLQGYELLYWDTLHHLAQGE